MKTKGVFYGVGVGPGDPELLTLRAVRAINECDVICLVGDSKEKNIAYKIAKGAVPAIGNKKVIMIDMPMIRDEGMLLLAHKDCASKIEKLLDEGADVAMLVLGDISIYSSFMYLDDIVKADGYNTTMISGIPSFVAAAAKAGISLTRKEEELHIIPLCYDSSALPDTGVLAGTHVYMKIGKDIDKLRAAYQDSADVVIIENCGMENEKIYQSLREVPEELGYYSLAIVKKY